MDPQQELFTDLKVRIESLGYDVYDGSMPPESASYPFVYMADNQLVDDRRYKDAVFGNVFQTVHVWHNNPRKRGTVSAMLLAIKEAARSIEYTNRFYWELRNVTQRTLTDDSTDRTLIHAVLELEYKFN